MQHLVLAPCTRRKRVQVEPDLRASALEPAAIGRVAEAWVARLRRSRFQVTAECLYAGRGLVEARRAASAIGAQLRIVSAGLGLVDGKQAVPAYSLTVGANDSDSIASRVVGLFSPGLWWEALHGALGSPGGVLASLLRTCDGLVILALPGTYLDLIADELASLPPSALARMRLVGPPRGMVGPRLADVWMPYDARFESPAGPNPGTRSDFAQRAARHFAEVVVGAAPRGDATTHAAMVERCLGPLLPPAPPRREVGTDAELIEVIRELLPQSDARSGETLRLLRHQAGRACEQGRFRRLFAAATKGALVQ
ncbi:MAG: hypothetical protein KIC89_17845 [Acetobacteraceae bacterium]|nr:hypothetical protein [Acetobacteraceae bacterium]